MKNGFGGTIFGFCIVMAAGAVAAADAQLELGAELYGEYCAECHGEDVEGLQGFSDDFPAFAARLDGDTEDMPDFADFFEADEVSALFRFLQSVDWQVEVE